MNKIWLITRREYLTRVLNKTFLLTTFLTPLGIIALSIVLGLIMGSGSDKVKRINVLDPMDILKHDLKIRDNIKLTFDDSPLADQLKAYEAKKVDGIIELLPFTDSLATAYSFNYHSDDQLALDETASIEKAISKKLREYKLKKLNVDEVLLKKVDTDVTAVPKTILKDKKISSITNLVSSILGGVIGYAMFIIIMLYGTLVMRSVMEEKINRVVEVLISSVKPFELMMGKVIGVGLVGLTQIGIWIAMIPIMIIIAATFFGIDTDNISHIHTANLPINEMTMTTHDKVGHIIVELRAMNWWFIIPLSLFYFLAGYFTYSAIFAAIGSAVGEDINEANSLTLPVMMPLILSIYIGISAVNAPQSSLAVWASMIPLVSSIVMPVRLPFEPPWWQIAISVVSLILFCMATIWLASRIYRVGILMYGKKASFKELRKWLFYKV